MKNKPNVLKSSELNDHAGYNGAREKLEKLELALAGAQRQVERAELRKCRASQPARHYLGRDSFFISRDDSLLEGLALRIISTATVSPEIISEAGSGVPEPPPTLDSFDIEIIEQVREASVVKELLRRAIGLQTREVLLQKNTAIAEICNNLRGERNRIARTLATALLQFAAALRDEITFMDRLRGQDNALADSLSPFPLTSSPSDPEAIEWVANILEMSPGEAGHLLAAGGESSREIA